MAAQFDTHKYVRALREAGMPEPQAETIIEAISDVGRTADLATKADIKGFAEATKADIKDLSSP